MIEKNESPTVLDEGAPQSYEELEEPDLVQLAGAVIEDLLKFREAFRKRLEIQKNEEQEIDHRFRNSLFPEQIDENSPLLVEQEEACGPLSLADVGYSPS